MAYCYKCGIELRRCIPAGDTHEREQCPACMYVHYENPRLLVGCFLYCGNELFWTKRATQPGKGYWSFPSGFVESGESLQEAAVRELYEETHIQRQPDEMLLMTIASVRVVDQIYAGFRCPVDARIESAVTEETAASGWFKEADAPWDLMAYPEQASQIREIYSWIHSGQFSIRIGEVLRDGAVYQRFDLR